MLNRISRFQKNLHENYESSQELKQHEKEAFQQLEINVKELLNPDVSQQEKKAILMKANAGKYWDKFGAICGKFMVYHIEKEWGEQAIQESLSKGAPYFIELYTKVQQKNPTVPKLPEELITKII